MQTNLNDSQTTTSTRRALLAAGAGLTAGLVAGAATGSTRDAIPADGPSAAPGTSAVRSAFASDYAPRPLPFDAARLPGLSAALLESHWRNNYGGSVRALNETRRRLSRMLDEPDLPAYLYNEIKREHLLRTGSVVLHEFYFGNLGGNGQPPSSLRSILGSSFGSFDRWETEFRRMASGLAGGSGWVVLGYSRVFEQLENFWLADHAHSPVATEPVLVLDMYEHSYHMDYGAQAARYVDAFMRNLNWEAVAARLEAAL